MIHDPASRPPLRYALLALVLILPALGLAGVATRALRADRRAAEADLKDRTEEIGRRVLTGLTNALAVTEAPRKSGPIPRTRP